MTVVDQANEKVDVYKIMIDNSLSLVAPAVSIDIDSLPLSAGDGIEITQDGYINAKVGNGLSTNASNEMVFMAGNGLSVVDGEVEVTILNLFGGTATEVNTPIDNTL